MRQQLQNMELGLHAQGHARGWQDMHVLLLLGGNAFGVVLAWLVAVVWQRRRAGSDGRSTSDMPEGHGSLLPYCMLLCSISK